MADIEAFLGNRRTLILLDGVRATGSACSWYRRTNLAERTSCCSPVYDAGAAAGGRRENSPS